MLDNKGKKKKKSSSSSSKSSYKPLKSVTAGRAKNERVHQSPQKKKKRAALLDRRERIHKEQMANKKRREAGLPDPKREASSKAKTKGSNVIKNYNSARMKEKKSGTRGRTVRNLK